MLYWLVSIVIISFWRLSFDGVGIIIIENVSEQLLENGIKMKETSCEWKISIATNSRNATTDFNIWCLKIIFGCWLLSKSINDETSKDIAMSEDDSHHLCIFWEYDNVTGSKNKLINPIFKNLFDHRHIMSFFLNNGATFSSHYFQKKLCEATRKFEFCDGSQICPIWINYWISTFIMICIRETSY